ncbi:MAG: DDE-type integrase/transposase/recombinase [Oscillospiraceae bacterium]|nr:DDE-type integrase/transposase/recombinase [Oscillospiraceae bacterium]
MSVLCIVDLFSRKVIAYRVSRRIDRYLAIDTLHDAVNSRKVSKGLIFHTDRGAQFTCADFRLTADALNITQSFSAKAHPYDNAVMECFFKYLKKEETDRRHYKTLDELKLSLFEYIVGYYNSYCNP